jgi:hypothetical protein
MWEDFMAELRETHLGIAARKRHGPSVAERLRAAYEEVRASTAGESQRS